MVIIILCNIELLEMRHHSTFEVTKKTLRNRFLAPFYVEATMPSTKYILVVAAKNVPGWRRRRKRNEVSNCVTFLGLQHTKWNFAFRVTNRPPNYPNCFEK